jgi:glycosyltransferase involved in cell wall biosynthesis
MRMAPLRICLDARLISGKDGGVEQVITGLASGLSKLTDGDEEYVFWTFENADEWLRPYVHGPCRILAGPGDGRRGRAMTWLCDHLPRLRSFYHKVKYSRGQRSIKLEQSDGTIERAKVDVMHFTKQGAFLTDIPSIYQPHDLQHLHLPQFFTPWLSMDRELKYRSFCHQARMVVAMSSWGKRDLVQHYGLPPEKVSVIPWGPVTEAYPSPTSADLEAARDKFRLPGEFVFYPAATWQHKNHLTLLSALAVLRDRYRLSVQLVCSGQISSFFPELKKQIRDLELSDQVRFLGFVSPMELQCLYQLCRCVIFPSKFEGFGMPLIEAFLAGAPAACSNVTCLPELAGDAAFLFDPDTTSEVAEAIRRLWTDEALRATLADRGRRNVSHFSWERTARIFRAHYRRIANRTLSEEDQVLLGGSKDSYCLTTQV